MDDALSRRLAGKADPSDEPTEEDSGMNNLSEQMVGGLAGVRALYPSGWEPPANPEWQDDQDDWLVTPTVQEETSGTGIDARALAIGAGVFLLAALPRLIVIFFVTDPQNPGLGWYGDTFHHWQIAYLSMEIGFEEGFLRLWDFKGLEFFWGLLHPLLLIGLFQLTGSIDILIPRLVSLVAGSISIVLIFFIARRYFNIHVAVAAALFAALNPVGMFSDASGMQEPLGVMLLLMGIAWWPRRPVGTGLAWALAGMVRAEYWIFGAGLLIAVLIFEKGNEKKFPLTIAWGVPILLYMKYLFDWTGNPIYPIYWNFLGNAAGAWMKEVDLNEVQVIANWGFKGLAVVAALGIFATLRRKPRHMLVFLLGLGNILFLSVLLGFSAYVRGFLPRFMVDRIFELPYIFIGLLIAAVLLFWLPRGKRNLIWLAPSWIIVIGVILLSQLAWRPIWHYYEPGIATHATEREAASEIASTYEGGVISLMEDRPWLTYFLARDHGIPGKVLEGQMYDPFAYISGDPFSDWTENREMILDWITSRNIKLLVFYSGKENYQEMIRREPEWFQRRAIVNNGTMDVYAVRAP